MDAGNQYSDWPLFIGLQFGKDLDRFKNLVLVHAGLVVPPTKLFATDARTGKTLRRETAHSDGGQSGNGGGVTHRADTGINESGELESAIGLPMNKETSHVMLCGNPQMVRDTQQLLKETRQMTGTVSSPTGSHDSGALLVSGYLSINGTMSEIHTQLIDHPAICRHQTVDK